MSRKVGIVGDVLMFLVKAILVALILGVIMKTPVMAKAIWSYCNKVDTGFVWVVNMACAMLISIITWVKTRKMKKAFRIIVSAFFFVLSAAFSEIFFWHAEEIWQLISTDISVKELSAAGFTLLAVTIAYIMHTVPQWSSGEEEPEYEQEDK